MWGNLCRYIIQQNANDYETQCNDHKVHYSLYVLEYVLIYYDYTAVQENVFFQPFVKEFLFTLYCKSKRVQRCIRRCILRYAYRRRPSCNTVDLSYTPFTEYKDSQKLFVIDKNKKYTFTHQELHNIIENSLTNADAYMISNPLPIKNPYTGISFSKELLYFLYLNMKFIPSCFRYFVQTHFDINTFLLEYESILRQHQIHKRIRNLTKVGVRQEMQDMMIEMCVIMSVSSNLAQSVFNITQDERECRQLLTHYYNYMYSLNPYQRQCECTTLIKKITKMAIPPP